LLGMLSMPEQFIGFTTVRFPIRGVEPGRLSMEEFGQASLGGLLWLRRREITTNDGVTR
jgi:hypothetical protein